MTHPTKKQQKTGRHLPRGVSRRDILQLGLAGMGLSALGPLSGLLPTARADVATQKFLVVIFLYGGQDGTNMLIPRTLGNYYSRRPNIQIAPGSELSLDSGPGATTTYGLHPKLTRMAARYAAGEVAFVNLVGYPTANLSHFTSQDIYSFGVRGEFAPLGLNESGWIARYADLYAPTSLGAVSVGVGRPLDLVGGTSNPLLVDGLSRFKFDVDYRHRHNHQHRLDTIRELLDGYSTTGITNEVAESLAQGHELADQVQAAVEDYTPAPLATYQDSDGATHNIHRFLRDIATLVNYGFETQVFYTGFGGFDTHSNQGGTDGRHGDLLDRLDTALESFAQDMTTRGVWDNTTIVIASEFGRRNFENGSFGTDHGGAAPFVVMGGDVNGGIYGRDLTTADLDQNWLTYDVDFRDIYRDIIENHLGADAAQVFPEEQPSTQNLGLI